MGGYCTSGITDHTTYTLLEFTQNRSHSTGTLLEFT